MSPTYTRRAHLTTCDDCGQVVGSHWRNKIAHTAVHDRHDTTAARAARVQAMGETRPRILPRSPETAKILDRFGSEFCDSAKILGHFSASLPKSYQNPTKEV